MAKIDTVVFARIGTIDQQPKVIRNALITTPESINNISPSSTVRLSYLPQSIADKLVSGVLVLLHYVHKSSPNAERNPDEAAGGADCVCIHPSVSTGIYGNA
jgi:hypothetical protein